MIIDNDLNTSIGKAINARPELFAKENFDPSMIDQATRDVFNLYYVAVTRAVKVVENATWLDPKPLTLPQD